MKKKSLLFLLILFLFASFFLFGCIRSDDSSVLRSSLAGQAYQRGTKSVLKLVPYCPHNSCAWGKSMFYKQNGKLSSFEKKDLTFECREPTEEATCLPEGTFLYFISFKGEHEKPLVCTKGFWEFTEALVPPCPPEFAILNQSK